MTHIWMRAETRAHERRAGLTPEGAARLIARGFAVTVERSDTRIFADTAYADAGCVLAATGTWPDAPAEAVILGLKELPDDGTPLQHHHIMFGHAFKGQAAGVRLLRRLKAGGGALLDLEYLVDDTGRRVAAFGYWAGYAGAAVVLKCWCAQRGGRPAGPLTDYDSAAHMLAEVQSDLVATGSHRPDALIVGARGRVGHGTADLCTVMGVPVTRWDIEETARGGPFPEVLAHELFFNCVLARAGTPVFVPADAGTLPRDLCVIGDIACDPESDFSPVKVYDAPTTWEAPALRVHETPPLDVMAIDNLPSLLPRESSEDFCAQLLPVLEGLDDPGDPVWRRAEKTFRSHVARL